MIIQKVIDRDSLHQIVDNWFMMWGKKFVRQNISHEMCIDTLVEMISLNHACMIVAYDGPNIICSALLDYQSEELVNIYTEPEYRDCGIATVIIRKAIQEANTAGLKKMFMTVPNEYSHWPIDLGFKEYEQLKYDEVMMYIDTKPLSSFFTLEKLTFPCTSQFQTKT